MAVVRTGVAAIWRALTDWPAWREAGVAEYSFATEQLMGVRGIMVRDWIGAARA